MDSSILAFIDYFNFAMFLLFALMYTYQLIYMFIAFKAKRKKTTAENNTHLHRYAVIIAARNEELVIGQLIKSIKNQNYPRDLVDIFIIADNCTDHTARVAKAEGAIVRERFNKVQVGKGYALDYMLKIIDREYSAKKYDGYFVFDADNLLDENYIAEMNKTFNQGYRVITSYRNSKNYDQNWISAGYDMTMTIMPAMLISSFSILVNGTFYLASLFDLIEGKEVIQEINLIMLKAFVWYYGILFMLGFITILTEWKKIHCSSWKKIAYTITFPLFMFTYIPISIVALFKDVEWKPIAHTVVKSLDDVR